mgnify:CR=1 FL=1
MCINKQKNHYDGKLSKSMGDWDIIKKKDSTKINLADVIIIVPAVWHELFGFISMSLFCYQIKKLIDLVAK